MDRLPPFIKEWLVFYSQELVPADAEKACSGTLVTKSGKTLHGVRVRMDQDSELDLKKACEGKFLPNKSTAVIVGKLVLEKSVKLLFGSGADWWFEEYIDGKLSVSTMKTGNGSAPSIFNNLQSLELSAGEHVFSSFVLAGGGGWTFCGGFVEPTGSNLARMPLKFRVKRLFPEREELTCGPWISHPDRGSMQINFVTDGNIPSGIDYRKKGEDLWHRAWDMIGGQVRNDRENHNIVLEGLEDGTEYEYRVVMLDSCVHEIILPEIRSFRTQTPDQDLHFFITGDTQVSKKRRIEMCENFRKSCNLSKADFFVHSGDIGSAYNNFFDEALDGFVSFLTTPEMSHVPFVPVRGNHENRGTESNHYFRYFAAPNGKSYYTFRYGKVFFIVLDSGEDKPRDPVGAPYTELTFDRCLMEEQTRFMKKVAATPEFQNAQFRIVLAHSSAYGQGQEYMEEAMRLVTDEWFAGDAPKYKLHVWFAGHIHRYLRTVPHKAEIAALNPPPRETDHCENCPYPVLMTAGPGKFDPQISGFDCFLKGDTLTIRSVLENGELLETVTVHQDGRVETESSSRVHLYSTVDRSLIR